jgi:hypothetical protein
VSDDWEVLGIAPGATPVEIRSRWLALVKQLHPDRHGDPAAAARLAEVNAAYGRLRLLPDPVGAASAPPSSDVAATTFAVDDFRPIVFEAVLLAAVDVGDVTHADEPFSLDMWVGGGSCHVELVPQAGGSVVSVDCINVDAAVVAEALAVAIARQGYGVTSAG